MNNLDEKFALLKKYSIKQELNSLNKRIYSLSIDENLLNSMTLDKLSYVHVKLHTSLSYKKPFAPIESIKKIHNLVAAKLPNHKHIDSLDD